jgi:hypothetical protein
MDKTKANKMLMKPQYKVDKRIFCHREVEVPPKEIFEPLGWDRAPIPEPDLVEVRGNPSIADSNKKWEGVEKHYRKFVTQGAEKCKEIMSKETDFNCYMLKRG